MWGPRRRLNGAPTVSEVSQSESAAIQSDHELLDLVQRQTLNYFSDFAHPHSAMARERSNPVAGYDYLDTVCSGGTGFGIMAMVAGAARGFLPRAGVLERVDHIIEFLQSAESSTAPFRTSCTVQPAPPSRFRKWTTAAT